MLRKLNLEFQASNLKNILKIYQDFQNSFFLKEYYNFGKMLEKIKTHTISRFQASKFKNKL